MNYILNKNLSFASTDDKLILKNLLIEEFDEMKTRCKSKDDINDNCTSNSDLNKNDLNKALFFKEIANIHYKNNKIDNALAEYCIVLH